MEEDRLDLMIHTLSFIMCNFVKSLGSVGYVSLLTFYFISYIGYSYLYMVYTWSVNLSLERNLLTMYKSKNHIFEICQLQTMLRIYLTDCLWVLTKRQLTKKIKCFITIFQI